MVQAVEDRDDYRKIVRCLVCTNIWESYDAFQRQMSL